MPPSEYPLHNPDNQPAQPPYRVSAETSQLVPAPEKSNRPNSKELAPYLHGDPTHFIPADTDLLVKYAQHYLNFEGMYLNDGTQVYAYRDQTNHQTKEMSMGDVQDALAEYYSQVVDEAFLKELPVTDTLVEDLTRDLIRHLRKGTRHNHFFNHVYGITVKTGKTKEQNGGRPVFQIIIQLYPSLGVGATLRRTGRQPLSKRVEKEEDNQVVIVKEVIPALIISNISPNEVNYIDPHTVHIVDVPSVTEVDIAHKLAAKEEAAALKRHSRLLEDEEQRVRRAELEEEENSLLENDEDEVVDATHTERLTHHARVEASNALRTEVVNEALRRLPNLVIKLPTTALNLKHAIQGQVAAFVTEYLNATEGKDIAVLLGGQTTQDQLATEYGRDVKILQFAYKDILKLFTPNSDPFQQLATFGKYLKAEYLDGNGQHIFDPLRSDTDFLTDLLPQYRNMPEIVKTAVIEQIKNKTHNESQRIILKPLTKEELVGWKIEPIKVERQMRQIREVVSRSLWGRPQTKQVLEFVPQNVDSTPEIVSQVYQSYTHLLLPDLQKELPNSNALSSAQAKAEGYKHALVGETIYERSQTFVRELTAFSQAVGSLSKSVVYGIAYQITQSDEKFDHVFDAITATFREIKNEAVEQAIALGESEGENEDNALVGALELLGAIIETKKPLIPGVVIPPVVRAFYDTYWKKSKAIYSATKDFNQEHERIVKRNLERVAQITGTRPDQESVVKQLLEELRSLGLSDNASRELIWGDPRQRQHRGKLHTLIDSPLILDQVINVLQHRFTEVNAAANQARQALVEMGVTGPERILPPLSVRLNTSPAEPVESAVRPTFLRSPTASEPGRTMTPNSRAVPGVSRFGQPSTKKADLPARPGSEEKLTRRPLPQPEKESRVAGRRLPEQAVSPTPKKSEKAPTAKPEKPSQPKQEKQLLTELPDLSEFEILDSKLADLLLDRLRTIVKSNPNLDEYELNKMLEDELEAKLDANQLDNELWIKIYGALSNPGELLYEQAQKILKKQEDPDNSTITQFYNKNDIAYLLKRVSLMITGSAVTKEKVEAAITTIINASENVNATGGKKMLMRILEDGPSLVYLVQKIEEYERNSSNEDAEEEIVSQKPMSKFTELNEELKKEAVDEYEENPSTNNRLSRIFEVITQMQDQGLSPQLAKQVEVHLRRIYLGPQKT